jgi:hypothetical protein
MIFFLEEVDPRDHETSSPCFMLKERGNNSRKMDLLEDRVFHGQLMETGFHKHILS